MAAELPAVLNGDRAASAFSIYDVAALGAARALRGGRLHSSMVRSANKRCTTTWRRHACAHLPAFSILPPLPDELTRAWPRHCSAHRLKHRLLLLTVSGGCVKQTRMAGRLDGWRTRPWRQQDIATRACCGAAASWFRCGRCVEAFFVRKAAVIPAEGAPSPATRCWRRALCTRSHATLLQRALLFNAAYFAAP